VVFLVDTNKPDDRLAPGCVSVAGKLAGLVLVRLVRLTFDSSILDSSARKNGFDRLQRFSFNLASSELHDARAPVHDVVAAEHLTLDEYSGHPTARTAADLLPEAAGSDAREAQDGP
jgi:hypothetical protein